MQEVNGQGDNGNDGIKEPNCLIGKAYLKSFGKRESLLNVSISRRSLMPLVEQSRFVGNKVRINNGSTVEHP